jgi:hypothetical protein
MATGFKLGDPREYRRGVVLGLTLAEVLVLLVFLLLLSMSALLLRRDREHAAMAGKLDRYASLLQPLGEALAGRGVVIEETDRLVGLIERGAAADRLQGELQDARRALDTAQHASASDARELSRLRAAEGATARVAEGAARYAALAAILERLPGAASIPLPERLERAVQRAAAADEGSASLLGQNAQMRGELARLKGNGGSGVPYCWALPDGRAQYMLKIEMGDTGVVVRDLDPRARPADPAWLLLDAVPRGRLMPMGEFIGQTAQLQARAAAAQCRYAVQVVDATGITNKPGYKQSMGRLWTVFMIREVAR